MKIEDIILLFETEFAHVQEKFVILKLLEGREELDYNRIYNLALPSAEENLIIHAGVYVFFGNGKPYRVGRHLANSRYRVLQHMKQNTGNSHSWVLDIAQAPDREILLFNVRDQNDYHWVAALEIYLENALKNDLLIPCYRQG